MLDKMILILMLDMELDARTPLRDLKKTPEKPLTLQNPQNLQE